jgi:hypothetical protein
MQESNLIIIALFFLIILFVACFGLGYYFGQKKAGSNPLVYPYSLFDLKMIRNWYALAEGEVKEISDRELTIISNGETIKVSVPENSGIQRQLDSTTSKTEMASFSDIKVGSKLNMQLEVLPKEKLPIVDSIIIEP